MEVHLGDNIVAMHWEGRDATQIVGMTPEWFVAYISECIEWGNTPEHRGGCINISHLVVENSTDTNACFMPIRDDNRHMLRTGYRVRGRHGLKRLVRWFDRRFAMPVRATHLHLVVKFGEASGNCEVLKINAVPDKMILPWEPAAFMMEGVHALVTPNVLQMKPAELLEVVRASTGFWEGHAVIL